MAARPTSVRLRLAAVLAAVVLLAGCASQAAVGTAPAVNAEPSASPHVSATPPPSLAPVPVEGAVGLGGEDQPTGVGKWSPQTLTVTPVAQTTIHTQARTIDYWAKLTVQGMQNLPPNAVISRTDPQYSWGWSMAKPDAPTLPATQSISFSSTCDGAFVPNLWWGVLWWRVDAGTATYDDDGTTVTIPLWASGTQQVDTCR